MFSSIKTLHKVEAMAAKNLADWTTGAPPYKIPKYLDLTQRLNNLWQLLQERWAKTENMHFGYQKRFYWHQKWLTL